MPSRTSTTDRLLRSPFRARSRRGIASKAPNLAPEVTITRMTGRTRGPRAARFEPELDRTTYNCGCGFVFSAPVSTSVACPHCGDSQAW